MANDTLIEILKKLCLEFGLKNLTYFGHNLPGTVIGEDVLVTTYAPEWVSQYFKNDYKLIDPIITRGSRSLLPVDWSEIPRDSTAIKTFFGEAEEFGVGRSGLTVAVRGAYGDTSLFSVNTTDTPQEWRLYRNKILSDLTYLAFLVHEHFTTFNLAGQPKPEVTLSPREQEVIIWAAKGKTAWETSQILGLKEKTVSFYLSKAAAKLGVATKSQAVGKVIMERLITF